MSVLRIQLITPPAARATGYFLPAVAARHLTATWLRLVPNYAPVQDLSILSVIKIHAQSYRSQLGHLR
jgi:hypothetical protein